IRDVAGRALGVVLPYVVDAVARLVPGGEVDRTGRALVIDVGAGLEQVGTLLVRLALRAARAHLDHLVLDLRGIIGAGRLRGKPDQDRAVVVVRREDRVDAGRRELRGKRARHPGRCGGGRGTLDALDDRGIARVDRLVQARALHTVGGVDLDVLRS